MKQKALQIFLSGVNAVLPDKLVQLKLREISGVLSGAENLYVLAFGKAAYTMAKEVEDLLGDRIDGGVVITKYGHGGKLKYLKVIEAGHPIPDVNGVNATKLVIDIASNAKENDIVLCLISGGASALLADYPEGGSLNDLIKANELLVKSGASISEINCVRKHISGVKGGRLAKLTYPAATISLILSDVVGDRLDVIASGATVPDSSTASDALEVIRRYNLEDSFPDSMLKFNETPKPGDAVFDRAQNHIIGNNRIALEGAAAKAEELGFQTQIITDRLEDDYSVVAEFILDNIDSALNSAISKPICLLFGGEPTLKVLEDGLGGRNQHLALYLADRIKGRDDITIICAGTDGTDGPTDSAGAVVDGFTIKYAFDKGIKASVYLRNFDSYNFFKQAGDHIITGSSGTNVMDLVVVLIHNT